MLTLTKQTKERGPYRVTEDGKPVLYLGDVHMSMAVREPEPEKEKSK